MNDNRYAKYKKEELIALRNNIIKEYNAYKEVVAQAYEAMNEASKEYQNIIAELAKR